MINDMEHGELLDKQSEAQDEVAAKKGTARRSRKRGASRRRSRTAEGVGGIAEGFRS